MRCNDLQTRKTLDKFFAADHIVAWQYPVKRGRSPNS